MFNKRKGITLIALVVTIVVLLILAGMTIAILLGDDGVLQKTHQSKAAAKYSEIMDLKEIWKNNNILKSKVNEPQKLLTDFTQELLDNGAIKPEQKTEIDANKTLDLGYGYIIDFGLEPDPYSEIQIGDIVIYDPREGATPEQLTYTSYVGSAYNNVYDPGNGHSEQTFTVNDQDTEWLVIGKENGQLKLMSKELKKNTNNIGLNFKGGQGYLYAEEQLHNICKIYRIWKWSR